MATVRASRAKHQGASPPGSLVSTITLGNPTGLTNDDYMLAIFSIAFGTTGLAVTAVPSGWTLLYASGAVSNGGGGYGYFWVYGKKAASEPGSRSWTLNNSVGYYNCQLVANVSVNTVTPYEQLSGTTGAGKSTGSTITRSVDTTGSTETVVSILLAQSASSSASPSYTEDVGTEQFDESVGGCDIAYNMIDVASAAHQAVVGTMSVGGGTTCAMAMVQLAFNPSAVNATITSPAAAATAGRVAPTVGPGIGAAPATATASAPVPPVITGNQTITVVPGLATATRVAPHTTSSRIALYLAPDVGGTIELVED